MDAHEVQEVRRELSQIRDKVNVILDSLDGRSAGEGVATAVDKASKPTHVSTPQPVAKTEGTYSTMICG